MFVVATALEPFVPPAPLDRLRRGEVENLAPGKEPEVEPTGRERGRPAVARPARNAGVRRWQRSGWPRRSGSGRSPSPSRRWSRFVVVAETVNVDCNTPDESMLMRRRRHRRGRDRREADRAAAGRTEVHGRRRDLRVRLAVAAAAHLGEGHVLRPGAELRRAGRTRQRQRPVDAVARQSAGTAWGRAATLRSGWVVSVLSVT